MPTNNTPFLTIYLLFLGLLRFHSVPGLEASTGNLASIPGLYVFGDSLVDAGNNNYLLVSLFKADYPQNGVDFPNKEPTGRFCNGKNAADAIAEKFGLPLPPPYLSFGGPFKANESKSAALTGVNFASGGAGIFNGTDQRYRQAIPLSYQVNNWLTIHEDVMTQLLPSEAQVHLSKALFFVVIGSNDLINYFKSKELQKQSNITEYTQSMAEKLQEQLKRVYDSGARRFLIMGVAPIGCAPVKRAKNTTIHECDEEVNMWCSLYNEALVKMLQQLKQELHSMTYTYFDNFKTLHDIISKPARYGFADVTSACCGNGELNAGLPCSPLANLCPDRTKHLFWDRYGHPTEATARTIVDLMLTDDTQYVSPLTLTQLVSDAAHTQDAHVSNVHQARVLTALYGMKGDEISITGSNVIKI